MDPGALAEVTASSTAQPVEPPPIEEALEGGLDEGNRDRKIATKSSGDEKSISESSEDSTSESSEESSSSESESESDAE